MPKKLPDPTEEEITKAAEEARKWALSPEGQKALKEVIEYTERVGKELEEASRFRLESLYVPFGIC